MALLSDTDDAVSVFIRWFVSNAESAQYRPFVCVDFRALCRDRRRLLRNVVRLAVAQHFAC